MESLKQDVLSYAVQQLENDVANDCYIEDLHHYLFNQNYFIIGSYKAEEWLKKDSIFNAIEKIREYEQSNFGEVSTDLSNSENVANMLAYILGEEVLNESMFYNTLVNYHTGVRLDEHRLKLIKEDLASKVLISS